MTKIYIFGNIFSVKLLLIYVIVDTARKMIEKELKYLLEKNNMSYQELAKKADIPLETMRNIYYGRVKNPHVSTALAIAKVFDITVNRLCGERYFTKTEETLIMNHRRSSQHGKNMIEFVARFEADLTKHERETENKYKIPCIIPIGAVADGMRYDSGQIEYVDTVEPRAYLAIECNTNRLAPTYCKGDKILLEDRYPNSGESGMFFDGNIIYFRKYIEHEKGYTLKSHCMQLSDLEFARMDKIKCMGTCIGVIRT